MIRHFDCWEGISFLLKMLLEYKNESLKVSKQCILLCCSSLCVEAIYIMHC